MEKPIVVSVSLIPSLLQYILVGIGVGRFQEMVKPSYREEIETWIEYDIKSRFSQGFQKIEGVSSSTWFALLYQLPAYLANDNVDSLVDVLEMLSTKNPLEVISKFPEKERLIREYIPPQSFSQYIGFKGEPPSPWPSILGDFIDAVKSGFDRTYRKKWKIIQTELNNIADTLRTDYFSGFDWIKWWEERTEITFPFPQFKVELIDTTTTQGTSLLAERDGFYGHADPVKITTMVSHEICTHLLYNRQAIENEILGPLIKKDLERYLRTVEVVSWTTNCEVIQSQSLPWTMEHSFDWIGEAKDGVSALVNKYTSFWNIMARGFERMTH